MVKMFFLDLPDYHDGFTGFVRFLIRVILQSFQSWLRRSNQGNPLILQIKVKFVIMHSLELQTLRAKVDEQSDFHFIRFEVVHGLCEMNVFQLNDGFKFDHDQFFDEKVHAAGADFMSAIVDGHFFFTFKGKVVIGEFDFKGTLVDHFLKSIAKCGMDFHGCGDNTAGEVFVLHGVFILPIMVIPQSY